MDAGLAAVLGATVGALGTGGAGIIAALLARSQARSGLSAEYARFIREPRKAAYTGYAEGVHREYLQLKDAKIALELASESGRPEDERTQHLATAQTNYTSVQSGWVDLEHRYAQVSVEGPDSITRAAVHIEEALGRYESTVLECLSELRQDLSRTPSGLEQLSDCQTATYSAYLAYLKLASRILGADGIRRLPE